MQVAAAAPTLSGMSDPSASDLPDVEFIRLKTNGVELHVAAAGPADGPLVVLLHGFPEFWYGWRNQIGPLAAAGLRVVAPDQRGYNLSDKPAGRQAYGLDTLANDVLGLADALGRKRFAVVGHDWGGALAWHLAARNPERIERAAVLNGPHPGTVLSHTLASPSQAVKGWYVAFFQTPMLPEWVLGAANFAWLRTMMVGTSRQGTFSEPELAHYRRAWAQPGALTTMLDWYRALPGYAESTALRPIQVPVRVIWGDRDAFLDASLVEAGLGLCRLGEVFHMPEATHWVQHEEPGRVSRLLADFLVPSRPPTQ